MLNTFPYSLDDTVEMCHPPPDYNHCLDYSNFADYTNLSNYYVVLRQPLVGKGVFPVDIYDIFPDDFVHVTWLEVSKLCMDIGRHLPVFTNKKELENLISLIKTSRLVPVIEAIYIIWLLVMQKR